MSMVKMVFLLFIMTHHIHNIKKVLEPAIENVNSTEIGFEQFKLPSHSLPMTSWFAGQLLPGDRTTATFTIENPTE